MRQYTNGEILSRVQGNDFFWRWTKYSQLSSNLAISCQQESSGLLIGYLIISKPTFVLFPKGINTAALYLGLDAKNKLRNRLSTNLYFKDEALCILQSASSEACFVCEKVTLYTDFEL